MNEVIVKLLGCDMNESPQFSDPTIEDKGNIKLFTHMMKLWKRGNLKALMRDLVSYNQLGFGTEIYYGRTP